MMKVLKPLAIAVAILALLAAAAIAYLAATFDAERVKQEVAQAVLAKTGRTLIIDGKLALSFWPSLGVAVDRVSLSERDGKAVFAAFDSAHVSVRVMPLLAKQIVVDRVDLDGLRLTLSRNRNGHLNIDDLLNSDDTKNTDDDGQKVANGPPQFDVAGIRLRNATLEWHDRQSGRDVVLSPLDIEAGHTSSSKDGISVEALKLSLKGKLDADDVEIKLDMPSLKKQGDKIALPRLVLAAGLSGSRRTADARLTLDNVEGTLSALKIAGLTLGFDAKMGNGSSKSAIKGDLQSPLSLDLDGGTLALPKITGNFSVDAAALPVHPLKLPIDAQLKSEFRKPAMNGSMTTQFDESHVAMRFNLASFSPLALSVDVDIDKLNVDRYLPATPASAKKGEGGAAPAKSGKASGDANIDLSFLRAINGSGSIRIGEVQAKNLKARNLRINFKAANGRLDIAPHSADLYGGHAAGTASMDANGNAVALKETLTGVSIGPLLKDLMDKDVAEGRGEVALDVATRGNTAAAMKKALSGNARMALRDGAIKGINIAQSLRNAKGRLNGDGADTTQQANATDQTDFSELNASFKIASGVAHNDDFAAKSPFLRLAGSGDIDIGNSQLNYLIKASVVGTSAGQGGKELEALKGLTVPVRVSGPFEKPAFKLELANLVNDAAKARIEEKQQEVKQKLQDNLKDRLKGLLGK